MNLIAQLHVAALQKDSVHMHLRLRGNERTNEVVIETGHYQDVMLSIDALKKAGCSFSLEFRTFLYSEGSTRPSPHSIKAVPDGDVKEVSEELSSTIASLLRGTPPVVEVILQNSLQVVFVLTNTFAEKELVKVNEQLSAEGVQLVFSFVEKK